MSSFLLVAFGGAAGACARYAMSLWAAAMFGAGFPIATLLVNAIGGLAMGVLAGFASGGDRALLLLAGTGFLGGFTTFSAFSLETIRLMEQGAMAMAGLNVLACVGLSLGACAVGLALARGWA